MSNKKATTKKKEEQKVEGFNISERLKGTETHKVGFGDLILTLRVLTPNDYKTASNIASVPGVNLGDKPIRNEDLYDKELIKAAFLDWEHVSGARLITNDGKELKPTPENYYALGENMQGLSGLVSSLVTSADRMYRKVSEQEIKN